VAAAPQSPPLSISAAAETWPIAGRFVIARGAKTEAHVVVATVTDGTFSGRGEAVPYGRYGESIEDTLAAIRALSPIGSRGDLARLLPPGAARNAIDCALWDLEAKTSGRSAHDLAGLPSLRPVTTCYTLSLDTPEAMAARAASVSDLPVLKLKLGGEGDAERMAAVRAARPDARLVADANEAWKPDRLEMLLAAAAAHRFELIEQPLPAGEDDALARITRPVPVCADESAHVTAGLSALRDRYDAVNIKLDKTGGLTEALAMAKAARTAGMRIMVGCMVSTSLAMAPAFLIAQEAEWVDLDGPMLLARDRQHGLAIQHGVINPPSRELWG
jgi:L-alanine-DL-glutamate epimerase-like enolase superfamily enzyme